MTSGIYCLTSPSGKKYFGQSWFIEDRWNRHRRNVDKKCYALYNAINLYGWENFIKEIIIVVNNQEDMDLYETECIKNYNTLAPNGYNLQTGGSHGRLHPDTIQKIREARAKQVITNETREKLSKALTGRVLSKESRQKTSDAMMGEKNHRFGTTHTNEWRQHMSELHSGDKNPFHGKVHTLKSRKQMTLSSATKLTEEDVIKIRSDNRTQQEIARDYNVSRSYIGMIKNYKYWKNI